MHYELFTKTIEPNPYTPTWILFAEFNTLGEVENFLTISSKLELGKFDNIRREADVYKYNSSKRLSKYRWAILKEVDD